MKSILKKYLTEEERAIFLDLTNEEEGLRLSADECEDAAERTALRIKAEEKKKQLDRFPSMAFNRCIDEMRKREKATGETIEEQIIAEASEVIRGESRKSFNDYLEANNGDFALWSMMYYTQYQEDINLPHDEYLKSVTSDTAEGFTHYLNMLLSREGYSMAWEYISNLTMTPWEPVGEKILDIMQEWVELQYKTPGPVKNAVIITSSLNKEIIGRPRESGKEYISRTGKGLSINTKYKLTRNPFDPNENIKLSYHDEYLLNGIATALNSGRVVFTFKEFYNFCERSTDKTPSREWIARQYATLLAQHSLFVFIDDTENWKNRQPEEYKKKYAVQLRKYKKQFESDPENAVFIEPTYIIQKPFTNISFGLSNGILDENTKIFIDQKPPLIEHAAIGNEFKYIPLLLPGMDNKAAEKKPTRSGDRLRVIETYLDNILNSQRHIAKKKGKRTGEEYTFTLSLPNFYEKTDLTGSREQKRKDRESIITLVKEKCATEESPFYMQYISSKNQVKGKAITGLIFKVRLLPERRKPQE